MNIPLGWYQLKKKGERIKRGDYCIKKETNPEGHVSLNEWEACMGLIGGAVERPAAADQYWVIRQGQDPDAVEKEWRNPWE